MEENNIKIHLIFIGKPQWEAGWPYIGYDNEALKQSILNHLKEKFPKMNISYNEILTTYNRDLVKTIKNDILNSDGIIIFTIGHYGDPGIVNSGIEFIEMGKPTILANYIYAGDHTFTKIYSSIKDDKYRIFPISTRKIEDFDKPIEVLYNLLRIKGNNILVYAADRIVMNWERILELLNPERKNIMDKNPEFINQIGKMSGNEDFEFYTDTVGTDQAHQWRIDEEKYNNYLKEIFGIEMIRGDPEEIVKYYDEVDEIEAKEIANNWIKNAKKIEPSESTILNSAKLYLAFKKILKEKKFKIFTPDCGTFLLTGILPAYPCLPFFELSKEGMYGICESDMDSAVSYIFGLYLTGRPGFVSNHTLDSVNNLITYMHCVAPGKLFGMEGPLADYEIWYHGETGNLGASPCVKFPVGESVTTIKISIFERKIEIRTGDIIDNVVDKKGCVSKMLVRSNVNKVLNKYDWDAFGWHRVTFIGNWKNIFSIGARLLGLEIVDDE